MDVLDALLAAARASGNHLHPALGDPPADEDLPQQIGAPLKIDIADDIVTTALAADDEADAIEAKIEGVQDEPGIDLPAADDFQGEDADRPVCPAMAALSRQR